MNMWFDQPSNTLVYDAEGSKIITVCQNVRQLGNGYVAVPASLYNLQQLRRQGFVVTPPMANYTWPGKFKPWEAQKITANFLAVHPRAFVLSDMGTGKSNSGLWAADFIMDQYPKGQCKTLIVSPLSTLRRVWQDAIVQTLLGKRTFAILHGSAEQRLKLLNLDVDFYIVNHDGLAVGAPTNRKLPWSGFAAALRDRHDIQIAIVDEASAYRDATTRRHYVARQIYGTKPYLWLMTGTPTPNAPTDAYGLAKLVNGAYGHTFTSFKNATMQQVSAFKWVPRAGSQELAKKLLSPAVRFAIEDCVDLPECTVQARDVELSAEQKKALKTMKDDLQVQIGHGTINAANEGVLRLKLIQIACGAVYDANREVHLIDASSRIGTLEEILEEAPGKVIVFAPLTSVVHMLHTKLSKKWSSAVINGQVPQGQRSEIFQKFQGEKDPQILIADPGTMAHGLTLTAARTIVWYAPTDRTEIYLQANKRIHRPGQKFTTAIVQIAATATEREIYRRLEANESMQGVILKLAEDR